jgi:hypothetical protein
MVNTLKFDISYPRQLLRGAFELYGQRVWYMSVWRSRYSFADSFFTYLRFYGGKTVVAFIADYLILATLHKIVLYVYGSIIQA